MEQFQIPNIPNISHLAKPVLGWVGGGGVGGDGLGGDGVGGYGVGA